MVTMVGVFSVTYARMQRNSLVLLMVSMFIVCRLCELRGEAE